MSFIVGGLGLSIAKIINLNFLFRIEAGAQDPLFYYICGKSINSKRETLVINKIGVVQRHSIFMTEGNIFPINQ